jgi:transposase InsO family protein
MELWQMDVMGRVFLAGGLEVKVVTGIDDHSRFIVCARVGLRATARPVCQALAGALAAHGVPGQILTDNGKVFAGRFGRGPGPVMDVGVIQALAAHQRPPVARLGKLVVLLDDRQLVGRGEGPPLRPVSPRTPRGGHQAILPHQGRHVCNGQCHCLVDPVSPY